MTDMPNPLSLEPKDDGGPAFPTDIGPGTDGGFQCGNERWHAPGMSLRDHFAGLALASGQASNWRDNDFRPKDGLNIIENTARHAYLIADAMLIARATGV